MVSPSVILTTGAVPAQVVKITDGDTIEVMLDGQRYKVRYILMNTPGTDQPFGDEATATAPVLARATDAAVPATRCWPTGSSATTRWGRLASTL